MHINWYPGHMKKTIELMQKNLKLVDVAVELLDARIPMSSRNPQIDKIIAEKPRVIALNKSDLADSAVTLQWIRFFKSIGINTIPIDSLNGSGLDNLMSEIEILTKPKMDALLLRGIRKRSIRAMIVGIPNVGKSSLINRLTGKKSAKTGDKPGVTKGKQWVKIRGNIELLDMPGVLWPKFEDEDVALRLAYTGSIKDEILDIETIALKLIEHLCLYFPDYIKGRYKIDSIFETALENMEAIAQKRGCILSGSRIDYARVANIVLDEFRSGQIGKITLEIPVLSERY